MDKHGTSAHPVRPRRQGSATVYRMLPIFVLLLGLAAVSQAQAAGRTLTVGYYDFSPVMYGDSHGVTRGEMAELTRLVLRRAGYRPRFRRLPSARLYTALKSGSVDIWLGAPGKPELRAHTRESAHSLGRVDLNLYHRADTPTPRIPESLVGQGVIVINGYSYWPSVNQLLQDPALDIRLLRTATHESALAMLRYRRADYLLDYQLPAEQARRDQGSSRCRTWCCSRCRSISSCRAMSPTARRCWPTWTAPFSHCAPPAACPACRRAASAPRLRARGRFGLQRVVRPVVFGIAAFEVLLHLGIGIGPEARQVLCHLHRPTGRR